MFCNAGWLRAKMLMVSMVPNSRPGATYSHLVKPTRNHTHCRIYLVVHGDDDDDDEEKDDKRKKVEGRLI